MAKYSCSNIILILTILVVWMVIFYVCMYVFVIQPSVYCLNKRSCGLRPSNVLHFPSYYYFPHVVIKCILVCSPGFVKDQFYEYMFSQAVKQDIKLLMENKPKFLLVSNPVQ